MFIFTFTYSTLEPCMRILLFHLLASCLLFLSNGSSGKPETKVQWQQSASLHITSNTGNNVFHSPKNAEEYTQQLSFLAEDDDEEYSSVKKKVAVYSSGIFANSSIAINNFKHVGSFKRFNKHFSYPSLQRYILHRVIIV